jgi:hypothetical protein
VKIEFVALFSDKCYFICLASVTWHFVKVDFVKKKKPLFKKLFHSNGILEILFSRKWVFLKLFFVGMLFSLCGISEMLSFSEVDFIRICFLLRLFRLMRTLWYSLCVFFKMPLLGIYRFFLTLSCCNYVTERCGLHIDTHPGIL